MSQWSKDKNNSVNKWLNESSILQDLSSVQGRVPVNIEGTRPGEKPPALNIKEETEEEFFKCAGDGEIPTVPDLRMIQHMLAMVRDVSPELNDEECPNKAVVITKPNFTQPVQSANNDESSPIQSSSLEGKKKPKRQRNFAMELLLQALDDKNKTEQATACNDNTVLRKPDDFLTVSPEPAHVDKTKQSYGDPINTPQAVIKKVTDWIDTPKNNPFPNKTSKVCLDASSLMFKKKGVVKEKAKTCEQTTKSPKKNGNEYKPSEKAKEYYQKYLEQKKVRESIREDVWARAEREMKELDEKRRKAVEVCKQGCEETQDNVVVDATFAPENEGASNTSPPLIDDSVVISTEESYTDQKTYCVEDKMSDKDNIETKSNRNSPENDVFGLTSQKPETRVEVDDDEIVENESEKHNSNCVDATVVVGQLIDIGEVPNVFEVSHVGSGDNNDGKAKLCHASIFDVHVTHFVENFESADDNEDIILDI